LIEKKIDISPEIYRIIDVNNNRAAEALRVIEEYFRFFCIDKQLQKKIKEIRHSINDLLLKTVDYNQLLAQRDADNDNGAKYSITTETQRKDISSIIIANFKRAQQSLRALEEYIKLIDASASESFKKIRFALYSLEKQTLLKK